MVGKFDEKEFLETFKKNFGGKYKYIGYGDKKVTAYCYKHDLYFSNTPSRFKIGRGCPKCKTERLSEIMRLTLSEFITKAKSVHGEKYDYSKANYIDTKTKIEIICPIHGSFFQTPNAHLQGQGCPKCGVKTSHDKAKKTLNEFIEEANKIHDNKYDYSKFNYINNSTKVAIKCPIHGVFYKTPLKHIQGQGCPKCAIEERNKNQSFTTESFIKKAKEIHGDKYDYSKTNYVSYNEKVTIICPIHGEFEQTPDSHLQGSGCRMCASKLSKNENEIYDFLCNLIGKENVIQSERTILPNHSEIDIYIPSIKLGIEYDGCRWHSEKYNKDKFYHLNKTEECKKRGITLIHIFEDEYVFKKDIVLNKLKYILHANNNLPKIGARKTIVSEIAYSEAKEFLDCNHIQGHQKATIYLGAKYNDALVGVMTFVKIKKDEYELNRFATNINYICQGLGNKLFSFFIKVYKPTYVKSFLDKRWLIDENDNIYTKMGFTLEKEIPPTYTYVFDGKFERIHKFNFRKQILHKKYGFPMTMTENEMTNELHAYKIWDCGLLKYVWRNE